MNKFVLKIEGNNMKDKVTIEDIRKAVDENMSGKIDPMELPNALRMIREMEELKESERRELKKQAIKESLKESTVGTVAVMIGVTLAGILMSVFGEFGILFF